MTTKDWIFYKMADWASWIQRNGPSPIKPGMKTPEVFPGSQSFKGTRSEYRAQATPHFRKLKLKRALPWAAGAAAIYGTAKYREAQRRQDEEKTAAKNNLSSWGLPLTIGAATGYSSAKATNKMIKRLELATNIKNKGRNKPEIEIIRVSPLAASLLGAGVGAGVRALSSKIQFIKEKKR